MDHWYSLAAYIYDNLSISDWPRILSLLAIIYGSLTIYYFLFQTLLHESGHLLLGKLTGFHLITIRVRNNTLINKNGKIIFKKYSSPGSVGQCLMYREEYKEKGWNPFVLYNLGGIIFDALFSILFLVIIVSPLHISNPVRLSIMSCAISELCSVLANGFPLKRGKINNDGTNTYYLLKDHLAVKSYYTNLKVLKATQEGKTFKEMPIEYFIVPKGADFTNALIIWHKINECYYYMDLNLWERALCCLETIENSRGKVSKSIEGTINTEKLFLYIKLNKSTSEIEGLYKKVDKLLTHHYLNADLIRVQMAYELYKDSPSEIRQKISNELEKLRKDYPYKGEAIFCERLVKDMMK